MGKKVLKIYFPVACKTAFRKGGYARGGEWGRFKYSEDAEYNDLVTAVRLDSLLGLVCKVAGDSPIRGIAGSGGVNWPVRVRLPVTGC